jgi:AraC-like DNA-binding protein
MNMSCLREVLDGQPARGAEPSQGGPQACDTLSDLLELVHIHGEAVLSCAPEPPFSLAFPATAPSMHTVARGMLTIRVEGLKDPIQLGPGEVLLLPHGAAHVVASGEAGATIDVAEALRLRFDAERYSLGSGTSTAWFWGSFSFDSLISRRLLDALPIVITLRGLDERPLEWFQLCWEIMVDESKKRLPGASLMVSRLLDIVFVKAVRRWTEQDPAAPRWLTATLDPRIANALSAFRAAPARPWQVADLAEVAGMSRSSFATQFKSLVGQSPGAYLTAWRLDKAAERLRNTASSIKLITEEVGYDSEAAFSRAFRSRYGSAPSRWRKQD